MAWIRENRELWPSDDQFKQIALMMSEMTELQVSPEAAREILGIFPYERAYLADEEDEMNDTEVRDTIADVIAIFLTGCTWPKNGDGLDIDDWSQMLVEAGHRLGFESLIETIDAFND